MSYFAHDPDAGPIDYSVDFTSWLSAGDTVSSVVWSTTPTGLTLSSPTLATPLATTNVDGGTLGEVYRVTCRATSVDGVVDDRSIILRCVQL